MEDPPDFNHHFTELIFGDPDSPILSHCDSSIIQTLKMYFYNFISQFQKLKSELSLNLYVLRME